MISLMKCSRGTSPDLIALRSKHFVVIITTRLRFPRPGHAGVLVRFHGRCFLWKQKGGNLFRISDHQKFDYAGCKCFVSVFTLKFKFYNAHQYKTIASPPCDSWAVPLSLPQQLQIRATSIST